MSNSLRSFTKTLPSLITAFALAIAVWIMAVTSSDPSIEKAYPNLIPIEVIGQASNTVINTDLPSDVSLTLRAPASIWNSLLDEKVPVRAIIDLSGLEEGMHTVPVQIQIGIKPIEIRTYNPRSITLDIQPLATQTMDIRIVYQGNLPVGYQSLAPQLSQTVAIVSGAKPNVDQVTEILAVVRLTDVKTTINQTISLQPVNTNGQVVSGVTVSPDKVTFSQEVAERGGYRNVVVKVVTSGQVANAFQLTNLSVFPPTVTVFSTDAALVDSLPGYVETKPIDLTGRNNDFDQSVELQLPSGVQIIETNLVQVSVGISPIESSLALTDVLVESTGLLAIQTSIIEPQKVDLIVTGPLTILQGLNALDLRVLVDLTGYSSGKYTLEPKLLLNVPGLRISSISPKTFVITIP
jgi:YbbR domain-containing protein